MKFFPIFAALAVFALSSCGPEVTSKQPLTLTAKQTAEIEGAVRYRMIDPTSTLFRNVRGYDATLTDGQAYKYICGEVNSKNRMGGYTGFSAFKGHYQGQTFVVDYVDDGKSSLAQYSCMN